MPRSARKTGVDLRRRIYEILERGSTGDHVSLFVDRLIVLIIVVNLAAIILESMPQFETAYAVWFSAVEYVSLVIFTTEYALRLWVAVEHAPHRGQSPFVARLKYATSGAGLIDLIAILPFWLGLLLPPEFRSILVLRIFRFLKIARYSPAMRSLLDVLYSERRALFGCAVILLGVTLICASMMHIAEGRIQPDKLGTIPDAMWWAIVTLGTIGYGDVVPVTAIGKIIASFTIVMGVVMIALPVGIIANAFSAEIHRRDFVVTWGMVSRVPLFSELDAREISDIMRLLRAQQIEAGAAVVRRGEIGESMYFIADGEVEIELPHERARLGVGHFFGEIAVLRRTRRSANVVALTRTRLLVLDARDLDVLLERDPRIAQRLRDVAQSRLNHELITPKGDLVTEEIDEEDTHHRKT